MIRICINLVTLSLALLIGLIWSSQFVGAHFSYAPWLGVGMARTGGVELYWPFAILWWLDHGLYAYAPATFDSALQRLVIVWLVGLAIVFTVNVAFRPVGIVKDLVAKRGERCGMRAVPAFGDYVFLKCQVLSWAVGAQGGATTEFSDMTVQSIISSLVHPVPARAWDTLSQPC